MNSPGNISGAPALSKTPAIDSNDRISGCGPAAGQPNSFWNPWRANSIPATMRSKDTYPGQSARFI
jgi:hypothetical protein